MKIEFDAAKSEKNAREPNLPFHLAENFDWETALIAKDDRRVYPENRMVAFGFLEDRLHDLCFTPIIGGVRNISYGKANDREVSDYEKKTADE